MSDTLEPGTKISTTTRSQPTVCFFLHSYSTQVQEKKSVASERLLFVLKMFEQTGKKNTALIADGQNVCN